MGLEVRKYLVKRYRNIDNLIAEPFIGSLAGEREELVLLQQLHA